MTDAVIIDGARTPFGKFGGSLKDVSATDLGVAAAKAALQRSNLEAGDIEHVVFGNVIQSSPDAIFIARHIGLKTGVPVGVPALTVNRLCGSGLEAIVTAARLIRSGEAETALAGGAENMSQIPFVVRGARVGVAARCDADARLFVGSAVRHVRPLHDVRHGRTGGRAIRHYARAGG